MRAFVLRAKQWISHFCIGGVHVGEIRPVPLQHLRHGDATSQSATTIRDWKLLVENLRVGDEVNGLVAQVGPAYILVDLELGVPGIVFRDQLPVSWADRAQGQAFVGKRVLVRVLSLNFDAGRLELTLRASEERRPEAARALRSEGGEGQGKTLGHVHPGLPLRHESVGVDGRGGMS